MDGGTRLLIVLGGAIMLGLLVLGLRWTWGTGRDQPGPRIIDPDDPTGDGLLEEVSRLPTEAAAQVLRTKLAAAGIRATVGRMPGGGHRLLVFHDDAVSARLVLRE